MLALQWHCHRQEDWVGHGGSLTASEAVAVARHPTAAASEATTTTMVKQWSTLEWHTRLCSTREMEEISCVSLAVTLQTRTVLGPGQDQSHHYQRWLWGRRQRCRRGCWGFWRRTSYVPNVRMVPTYMLAVMLTGHTAAPATASGSDKESEMVLCDGGRRGRRLSLAAPCSSGSSDYIQAG